MYAAVSDGGFDLPAIPFDKIDPQFLRPAEVDHLVGDASKARETLGWEPRTTFRELVAMMDDDDLERLSAAGRAVAQGSEP